MNRLQQRKTFTAVSFLLGDSRPESAYSISYVHYLNGKPQREGTIHFRPICGGRVRARNARLFEDVFEDIRLFICSDSVPVLVWDARAVEVFNALIYGSGDGIDMRRPPRYFKVMDYASFRIGRVARSWDWERFARKMNIDVASSSEPNARQIAELMIRLEDTYNFPPVVAKAFCKFCDSILEDGIVTINEAVELHSLVLLLSEKYPEFRKLEKVLDDVLEDGEVTERESRRLIRILTQMSVYYKKFSE